VKQCLLWAYKLEARFLIFDRVKREYLGERRGRPFVMVRGLFQENGWRSWLASADGGELFQREKRSVFMRDLLFSGACPCGRRV